MTSAATTTAPSAVQQALFSGAGQRSVWAVLDCARDTMVYAALLESRLEFRCLYSGRLPRELEMVAPHLVELPPGHRLTQRLLDGAWSHSWGVFVHTREPENLRHHLRKILRVRGEWQDSRPMLFRYYDPRVLRTFLPVATAEQLAMLFVGVDAWWAEDGERGVWEFKRDARGALQRRHVVPAAG